MCSSGGEQVKSTRFDWNLTHRCISLQNRRLFHSRDWLGTRSEVRGRDELIFQSKTSTVPFFRQGARMVRELINQLDGFDPRGNIKILMATNRPDTLDPALVRPGRLDRKVEFNLLDLEGRTHIFKIHTKSMSVEKDIRYELLARLCPNSTGAELRSDQQSDQSLRQIQLNATLHDLQLNLRRCVLFRDCLV